MALGINTNVASINAQNQLSKSQSQNDQALERLSSGLRINSAKDDAAGLAISTRFESQVTGLETASRNANDGISLAQTAEGALDEITNNLQRVRELSVQASNATNNSSDRAALNDEVQQRLEEIDRIAAQTDFNGLNVLDGSLESQDFQVGANRGQTIGVDLSQGSRADQIGGIAEAELDVDSGTSDASFSLSVGENTETIRVDGDGDASNVAKAINEASIEGVSFVEASNTEELTLDQGDGSEDLTLTIENVGDSTESESITLADDSSEEDFADAINSNATLGSEGISASVNDDGNLELSQADGKNFDLNQSGASSSSGDGFSDESGAISDSTTYAGTVDIAATKTVDVADGSAGGADAGVVGGAQTESVNGAIADVDISEKSGANTAISRVDAALETINSTRSELGAVQNRFESTISNLDNSVENLEAANSRIKDADFAAESAKLSQSQVLQQAGISVLSQANQRPQQVLSLLQ